MTTVFATKAYLPDGWSDNVRVTIVDGQIASVDIGVQSEPGDTRVGFAIPGICNAHSHAFQRALAGHTEQRSPEGRDNFWTWRERMYELAGRVSADALTAIARQAYCEMLCAGYTAVAEFHYLHRDPFNPDATNAMFQAIVAAARDSGIRLTYVPVHYERAGFADPEPTEQQATFAMSVDEFLEHRARAAESDDIVVGIGAHSLRAVTPDSLERITAVASDAFIPMHIHVAEQQREVVECTAAYGARPVQWLLDNFNVAGNWCLVHATHIDDAEIGALAASGAVVGLCPSTEANLGDGLFPLQRFLHEGGRIAIGSDSHISINPFEELRWLEYGQRLVSQTRNVVSLRNSHVGSELFDRALEGGAAAGGQQATGLQVGANADLVALNDEDPMLAGHNDESRLDALVFSGYPLPVERVMVAGEWRVIGAMHVERDRARDEFARAVNEVIE